MRKKYNLELISPKSYFRAADFVSMVRQQCALMPSYVPNRWGDFEPLKNVFDAKEIEALVDSSSNRGQQITWKRTGKPRASGTWFPRLKMLAPMFDAQATVTITVMDEIQQFEAVSYLEKAGASLEADFGFIDSWDSSDKEYSDFLSRAEALNIGGFLYVTSHVLRHWLPDVFWANVFGPPYVRMFGLERLLDSPVFRAKQIGQEAVCIQLTESITDVHEKPELIKMLRHEVKEHLGVDAFFDFGREYDWRQEMHKAGKVFRVPVFDPRPDH